MLSYNNVLIELQDYMLNNANIQKSLKMKIVKEKMDVKEPRTFTSQVKKQDLFIPNQEDSLFWTFYIIKNGDVKYETLNYKNSLMAKQQKIDLISSIRKNKDTVKMYKFDTITNLESNLANDNKMNPKTFLTLCAIENINVVYVNKKTYYELLTNDTNIVYIVHDLASQSQSKYYRKYGFEMATKESLNTIRETLYKLDHIDKPIRTSSAYKVQDLQNICIKLGIEIVSKDSGKNKTKNDLYESIIQYF
jgi:hypothetical protein